MSVHHDPVMMNLWDVPDMNVGDMVNGYTYVFLYYTFISGYYNLDTTRFYNFDTVGGL